jgi:cell shape-determining protein MreC
MSTQFTASETTCLSDDTNDLKQLKEALEAQQERNRALQIRMAQLLEQHSTDDQISTSLTKSRRLVLPTLIEVAVLGDSLSERWRAGKLLDQGAKNGVRENELVLSTRKSKKPLIDVGEDLQISTEDALLLGRCVIGKVETVGRWTSTIQMVTDAQYRGRAQLIRQTSEGLFVFEAQGILTLGMLSTRRIETDCCRCHSFMGKSSRPRWVLMIANGLFWSNRCSYQAN